MNIEVNKVITALASIIMTFTFLWSSFKSYSRYLDQPTSTDFSIQLGDNEDGNEDFSGYRSEAARLASFTDWPVPFIQPADLASAGFFFINREDSCRY